MTFAITYSAIYSNVEFMSESRTTQAEPENILQEVHAVIQDMTDMLDSLLLLAKTGQPLHPRWTSLNKVVEHAVCMVRAHPDARSVDLVIQDGVSVAGWMDCTKLGSAVYNLLLNACQAARLRNAAVQHHDIHGATNLKRSSFLRAV
jgi:signal transduction histidine kinase